MNNQIDKFINKLQISLDEVNKTENELIMANKANTEQTEMYVIMLDNVIDEYYKLCHVMFANK